MNASEFLTEAAQRGISISLDGGSLYVKPENIPAKTVAFIRQHKQEITEALTAPRPHGACFQCGDDTECMLTRPDNSWDWQCIPCFDRGATVLPETQKAEMVRPI